MKFSVCLIVLLLTISHFTVYSVPIRDMVEEKQPVKVNRRDEKQDSEYIHESLKESKFARELANVSLPSYLKDLYVNFNFPSGPANAIKDQKMIKANTIRSFENKAIGKLTVLTMAKHTRHVFE